MSTRSTIGASAAVAALLLSTSAPVAQAAEPDTTPPELVGFEVDPTVIDARAGGMVTATMHITDETCLNDDSNPQVELNNAVDSRYGGLQVGTRVSGDCTDGVYRASFPISDADMGLQPFGSWNVTIHPLSDTVGNTANLGHASFFEERYFTYAASPEAATSLVVTDAGTTAVSASWSAPESNGSAIIEYVVRIKDATGATLLVESVGGAFASNLAVSLEPEKEYSFEVTAHNMIGGTETATTSFVPQEAGYTPPAESPFADITPASTFYKEMAWMAENRISGGWDAGGGQKEYRPHTAVDRDVMAAFLYRLAGSPAYTAPAESPFVDVTPASSFYKEMAWMAENRISGGWNTDAGKMYRPHTAVDRDVMAAFLYRLNPLL